MSMHESVNIIIRPHISIMRAKDLANTIANRLWPGAAGGVQWLTIQRMAEPLSALICEVKKRGQPAKVRFTRDGMSIKMEPADT